MEQALAVSNNNKKSFKNKMQAKETQGRNTVLTNQSSIYGGRDWLPVEKWPSWILTVWLGVRCEAEVLRGSWEPSEDPGVRGREEDEGPVPLVGVWGRGRVEEASVRDRERVKVAPRVKPPVGMVLLVVDWVSSSVEVSLPWKKGGGHVTI